MKVATLAFVAAYFAVQAEAGLPDAGSMEKLKAAARKFQARKLSYSYGGNTYNSGGYIANPSRSAIERANNAGALTRSEYNRLTNRDEDNDSLGDRWSFGGSTPSYSYGGNTYNRGGYIANPSRSAIERANNAGALTRSEYNRLTNRDEDDALGVYPNCDSSPDCSRGRRRLEMAKKSASKGKEAAKKSAGTQKKKGDDAKKSAKKEMAVKKQTESA